MQLFSVHLRRHGLDPDRDLVLVKEGFSWPAFFLPLLFALWHRLWLMAAAVGAVLLAFAGLDRLLAPDPLSAAAVSVGFSTVAGLLANDLLRRRLDRRGFAFEDVVSGRDRDEALRRFLDNAPELAADMADEQR